MALSRGPGPCGCAAGSEHEALPGHSHSPSVACCLTTCPRQWSDGPHGTISPELCTVWLVVRPFLLTFCQISTRNNVCSPSSRLIGSLPVPVTPASPTSLVVPNRLEGPPTGRPRVFQLMARSSRGQCSWREGQAWGPGEAQKPERSRAPKPKPDAKARSCWHMSGCQLEDAVVAQQQWLKPLVWLFASWAASAGAAGRLFLRSAGGAIVCVVPEVLALFLSVFCSFQGCDFLLMYNPHSISN